jgi:hypothetical protein
MIDLVIVCLWSAAYGFDRVFVDGDTPAHAVLRFTAWAMAAAYVVYAIVVFRDEDADATGGD